MGGKQLEPVPAWFAPAADYFNRSGSSAAPYVERAASVEGLPADQEHSRFGSFEWCNFRKRPLLKEFGLRPRT